VGELGNFGTLNIAIPGIDRAEQRRDKSSLSTFVCEAHPRWGEGLAF
jgi:hypothetical protein